MHRHTLVFAVPVVFAAALAACSSDSNTTPPTTTTDAGKDAKSDLPDPLVDLPSNWRERAAGYLDAQAAAWLDSPPAISNVKCAMSCHTTFPYVLAHTALTGAMTPAVGDTRNRIEARLVEIAAGTAKPYYGKAGSAKEKESHATEAVLNATALAMDDVNTGATLGAKTKQSLDRMWELQRADGTWDWLEYGLFPWETRNDWAVAMAAMTAGSIPSNTTAKQAAAVAKMKAYIKDRMVDGEDPVTLHDRVALLWAKSAMNDLITDEQAAAIADEVSSKQLADGGFSLGSWGSGKLAATTAGKSDGYATAFATLALCKSGKDGAKRDDVRRGLTWLATHQEESGAWLGASVNSKNELNKEYMSDAATAYAAMAITVCGGK